GDSQPRDTRVVLGARILIDEIADDDIVRISIQERRERLAQQARVSGVGIALELCAPTLGGLALAELAIVRVPNDTLEEALLRSGLENHCPENLSRRILRKPNQRRGTLDAHSI